MKNSTGIILICGLLTLAVFNTPSAAGRQLAYDGGIVVDHGDPGYTEGGAWETVTGNYYTAGQSWTDVRASGQDGAWAKWTPDVPKAGKYRVYFWHVPCGDNNATIEIAHNGQTETISKDLEGWHLGWSSLGDYDFVPGENDFVKITRGGKKLLVDAVKFLPVENIRPIAPLPPYPKPDGSVPRLDARGNLLLSGQPYLPLYQELEESTVAKPELIPTFDETFDIALAQGVNTVGVTLMWKHFEPEEGQYDYRVIDALIEKARARNMHLNLVLFFAWRNLQSYFVPNYIMKDKEKYPPIKKPDGSIGNNYVQSPFDDALREAETKALVALFRRVKEKDPDHQVVIMAQLENEMSGLRDYSEVGMRAWREPVPPALMDFLQKNAGKNSQWLRDLWNRKGNKTAGTWDEIFSEDGSRLFGAWTFGRYVEQVAAALKQELPIPLYQNAWAGESPSYYSFMDVLHAAAPSLDGMGPDAYGHHEKWEKEVGCSVRPWNHLFIAEQHHSASTWWRALANYNAIISGEYYGVEGLDWLCITETNRLATEMMPLLCAKRGTGNLLGFFQGRRMAGEQWSEYFQDLKITYTATVRPHTWNQFDKENPAPSEEINNITGGELDGCGILVAMGNGEYIATSTRIDLTLAYLNGGPIKIDRAEQGHFENGVWKTDGPAEVVREPESARLKFPTANKQYGQIRFHLASTAANPAQVFEAEKGDLLKYCILEYDRDASGALFVARMGRDGDGVEIPTAADFEARSLTVRYAAEGPCQTDLIISGTKAGTLDFPATGSATAWWEVTQNITVPKGATLTVQWNKGPRSGQRGPSIDCVILSAEEINP
ncbi:MAG: DUF5597 domain-containing protein [Verrucomicrobiales bacterium]|jgi:hypothetical protein|nr:DUF5597 domain-containing protein [Verrucomicrobiales bacterium]